MRYLSAFAIAMICATSLASAQSAISLSNTEHDTSLPVEMAADSLSVDQASNSAVFQGNARVSQGDLRLGAEKIKVIYSSDQSSVERVEASGSVLFTNGSETAEAQSAAYSIDTGKVVLRGNVLLLQGPNAISGDTLTLDIVKNTGNMTGNVKSVFVPQN